ncbi:MAG: hypothetical protein AAFO07_22925, partial [Bacteroidota bacterium]
MQFFFLISFISLMAVGDLTVQDSHSEKEFQSTLEKANEIRGFDFDSSITVYQASLDVFTTRHQKIELLNQLGRTYELKRQLDSALITLEKAKELLQQGELNVTKVAMEVGFHNRTYF